MKKIIQILSIAILLIILLLIVVLVFNPANLRAKIIGGIVNNYLENNVNLGEYASSDNPASPNTELTNTDKNPLLNESQEIMLENLGIDVSKLPTEITPAMQACFMEKLGQERAIEIVNGSTPGTLEIMKVSSCLGA